MIAVVGEQTRHALRQRRVVGAREHQRRGGPSRLGHRELGNLVADALQLQTPVDAFGQRHCGQPRAHLGDQRLVFGQRRHGGPICEQRIEMRFERAALFRGDAARQAGLPIGAHVQRERLAIEVRRVVQHHVGLERLVLQFGVVGARLELVFDAQRQARQQRVDQHAPVRVLRRSVELAALVQTEAHRPRRRVADAGARQIARRLERRQQRRQIDGWMVRRGLQQHARARRGGVDPGDIGAVLQRAHAPCAERAQA